MITLKIITCKYTIKIRKPAIIVHSIQKRHPMSGLGGSTGCGVSSGVPGCVGISGCSGLPGCIGSWSGLPGCVGISGLPGSPGRFGISGVCGLSGNCVFSVLMILVFI